MGYQWLIWVPIWVPKKEKPTTGVGFRGVFVPGAGIEPARTCIHWFLRPTRLPIPPSGQLFLPVLGIAGPGSGKQGRKNTTFFSPGNGYRPT